MKHNAKRLLSVAICLIMVLSMLPVAALAVGTTTLYCQAPDGWSNCNVYWWGSSDTNPAWPGVAMQQDEAGIWKYDVPSDATNVIFNDGSDQSSDLVMPTDENVMYVYAKGSWAPYGKVETAYYVAGTMNGWKENAADYLMTEGFNGVWYLELTLTAGDYELKVTDGTWTNSWGDAVGGNYCFTVATDGVVEVVFDSTVKQVTVTGDCLAEKEPLVITSVHVVGSPAMTGSDWVPVANEMACEDGVYTITFTDVPAGTFEFKFAANGAMDITWASGVKMESGVEHDAWIHPLGNSSVTVEDNANVTLTLDLSTMDAYTGLGGKCMVTVDYSSASEITTEVIAEGSADFADADAAFNGKAVTFTPVADGTVTVEILSCDPGYYVDVYSAGDWLTDFAGSEANTLTFDVTGGSEVGMILCTYTVSGEDPVDAAPGSISYKISYTYSADQPGDDTPENQPGCSPENPKVITGAEWNYIPGNTTIWFLYDNYQNMVDNGVYSMMLHVNSGATYSVTYNGTDVPVDENGFVNYEMKDTDKQGKYLFSVTNLSSGEAFFGVEVKERPVYVNNGGVLKVGSNSVTLDSTATYTLYEFAPVTTGIYRITTTQGVIGDWGTAYNPQDNTPTKTNRLEWTCTAIGQSVMIGFTGAKTARATVIRIGDYIPEVEIPYVTYENTYDFSYEMPADPTTVDIDLLDGGFHAAYLGADGFYHYGSACGPLMVSDLTTVEINLEDAYVNGGLRVWLKDESGETLSKTDYNEAMKQYLDAGLVPVTQELVTMLSELGEAKLWWEAEGFVFGETVPSDLTQVWMQLCAYLEGSTGHNYVDGTCSVCGEDEPPTLPTTPAEIIAAAYALADGETLQGTYTLTGRVTAVNTAYNATYGNITVTIAVEGCEDQPIKCYRLCGEGVDTLGVNDIITVTGSLTNYKGSIQFAQGCTLDHVEKFEPPAPPEDPKQIVADAYALEVGASLAYTATLTGVVTGIDSPYSSEYHNITVTMVVEGCETQPIQCYRLSGEGADNLAVDDTITVTGTLTNFNGKVQFAQGCTLDHVEKGDGETPVPPEDPKQIVDEAYALEDGKSLPYNATLTGEIINIDTPYSEQYENITVTIAVSGREDKPIQCFRLKGEGIDVLQVGDIITVSGSIKNYKGLIEFTAGCQLEAREPTPGYLFFVSGNVTSSDLVAGDVTLELVDGSGTTSVVAVDGSYELGFYTPAVYTLRFSKDGHVTREYTIDFTVSGQITLDVEICLLGDVNGDGQVNTGDVAMLYAHVKGSAEITDEYALACADVTGEGLNIGDVAAIFAHAKGTELLF